MIFVLFIQKSRYPVLKFRQNNRNSIHLKYNVTGFYMFRGGKTRNLQAMAVTTTVLKDHIVTFVFNKYSFKHEVSPRITQNLKRLSKE